MYYIPQSFCRIDLLIFLFLFPMFLREYFNTEQRWTVADGVHYSCSRTHSCMNNSYPRVHLLHERRFRWCSVRCFSAKLYRVLTNYVTAVRSPRTLNAIRASLPMYNLFAFENSIKCRRERKKISVEKKTILVLSTRFARATSVAPRPWVPESTSPLSTEIAKAPRGC
jgi:hypothetical protein